MTSSPLRRASKRRRLTAALPAEPDKKDWEDPAIRDKARAYRALGRSAGTATPVGQQDPAPCAAVPPAAEARYKSQSVARLLARKTAAAKSRAGAQPSSAVIDAALAAKAAQMRDEIEARRQEALARRQAREQEQAQQQVEGGVETRQTAPDDTADVRSDDVSGGSPPDARAGGMVRSSATPRTQAKRFPAVPWLSKGSHLR